MLESTVDVEVEDIELKTFVVGGIGVVSMGDEVVTWLLEVTADSGSGAVVPIVEEV